MDAAVRGAQVPTATAGAVRQDLVEPLAGLHITLAPTGGGGSCRQRRVVWGAQDTVVLLPENDDSRTADETAAGVVQGADATSGVVVEAADAPPTMGDTGAAGAAPTADTGAAGAAPTADTGAAAAAPTAAATAGVVVEVPAERGLLPGSSSVRPPPPGGKAEGRWKGWYDDKRWHVVRGKEMYRSYGEGPETGGHDCPQSADPLRTERNRRKKAKKERIRKEREADEYYRAQRGLWNRCTSARFKRRPPGERRRTTGRTPASVRRRRKS